ncbi:hypothetical protein [Nannocystis pusilla]|uniref:hypothetical protein n=1 Tax=Nannocystis pusilla TaxID=889268 RepID=UPI003B78ED98
MHGIGQVRVFSARAEFPEAWRSFVAAGSGTNAPAALHLDLTEERFPHPQTPQGTRKITYVAIFARWPNESQVPPAPTFTGAALAGPDGTVNIDAFTKYKDDLPPEDGAGYNYILSSTTATIEENLGAWTITLQTGWPAGKDPEDFYIVVGHKLS